MAQSSTQVRKLLSENQKKPRGSDDKPGQAAALKASLQVFNDQDKSRANIVMACGTGKTMVQLWTAQELKEKPSRIVVFVPTLALLKQVRDEWIAENSWAGELKSICVCSDKTIGAGAEGEKGKGGAKGNKSKKSKAALDEDADEDNTTLADLGMTSDRQAAEASDLIYSTTDAKEINRQIDLLQGTPDAPVVVFSTYQSADVLGAAMKTRSAGDQAFDFGIFDEAHKTVGSKDKTSVFALHDKNLEIKKRAFYTATPKVITQRKKDKDSENTFASMDKESLYGERAYTLSTSDAIKEGLIVDYKIIISVIDDSEVEKQIDRESLNRMQVKSGQSLLDAKMAADQIVVNRTMGDYKLKKGILYHARIDAAESHAQFGNDNRAELGNNHIQLYSVSGNQKMAQRESTMASFGAAEYALISNARCLTEGIDVPAVDLVAFMDPKKSAVDIAQAVGRAMRNAKDADGNPKKLCYVLLPIHIKKGEELEDVLRGEGFKKIVDVLSALATNDDSLQALFQSALKMRGEAKSKTENGKTDVSDAAVGNEAKDSDDSVDGLAKQTGGLIAVQGVSGSVDSKIIIAPGMAEYLGQISLERLANSISTRLIDEVGDGWWERLGELAAYKAIHGDCNVSGTRVLNGKPNDDWQLGRWCWTQRVRRKKLSPERFKALQDLRFSFDLYDDAWNKMFAELEAYKAIHKNCNVKHIKFVDGKSNPYWKLSLWCSVQRQKKDKISPERLNKLISIGLINPIDKQQQPTPSPKRPGKSVAPTVTEINKSSGGITQNPPESQPKTISSNSEGIVDDWYEMLGKLQAFIAAKNKYPNPKAKGEEGELGRWVSYQRSTIINPLSQAKDEDEERKIHALDLMGFKWYEIKAWEDRYDKRSDFNTLMQYLYDRNGIYPIGRDEFHLNLKERGYYSTSERLDISNHDFINYLRKNYNHEINLKNLTAKERDILKNCLSIAENEKIPYIDPDIDFPKKLWPYILKHYGFKFEESKEVEVESIPSAPQQPENQLEEQAEPSAPVAQEPQIKPSAAPTKIERTTDEIKRHIHAREPEAKQPSQASLDQFQAKGKKIDDANASEYATKDGVEDPSYRPYQRTFRENILHVCGGRCVISGDPTISTLQAAHRGGHGTWRENNTQGWLLQSNLHLMMDAKPPDLTIEVGANGMGIVKIASYLEGTPVWKYNGKEIPMVDTEDESTWPVFIDPTLKDKQQAFQLLHAEHIASTATNPSVPPEPAKARVALDVLDPGPQLVNFLKKSKEISSCIQEELHERVFERSLS